jgi:hypothetical protein
LTLPHCINAVEDGNQIRFLARQLGEPPQVDEQEYEDQPEKYQNGHGK